MSAQNRVVLSLISHTNIGKTSLARTLLRLDVGTVDDRAHVTDQNTSHVLAQTSQDELILWDTPGFGNVRKLLKRFQNEGKAWNWLKTEVVDRMLNRSFYCSIEAARNVRHDADVVLYLVNVREEPEDAGYIAIELDLIELLDKPVLLILNQVPLDVLASTDSREALIEKWRRGTAAHSCVKGVTILDAFHRFRDQEVVLLTQVEALLAGEKAQSLARIRAATERHLKHTLEQAALAAAQVLIFASQQRTNGKNRKPEEAIAELSDALQGRFNRYLSRLIDLFEIKSDARAELEAQIQQVSGLEKLHLPAERTGLISAVLGGASSGLAADLMAGGLTFGGGMLLGALGGFLGGYSVAKVVNMRHPSSVTWQPDALNQMIQVLFIYYALTALHGRGKGNFIPDENRQLLAQRFEKTAADFAEMRETIAKKAVRFGAEAEPELQAQLERLFQQWLARLLD